jgi:hypothetical protein
VLRQPIETTRTIGNSVLQMKRSVRIAVGKSAYHHLSQTDIASDKPLLSTSILPTGDFLVAKNAVSRNFRIGDYSGVIGRSWRSMRNVKQPAVVEFT